LRQHVERREATDVPIPLAHLIAPAEAATGFALRVVSCPALLLQIGNEKREMQVDFLVVIAQAPATGGERPQSAEPAVHAHGRSPAGARNRASTAEMCDQRAVSF
jgi:hypothetical protein